MVYAVCFSSVSYSLTFKNRIDNLFPVCRDCHNKAHSDKSINEEWKAKLLKKISDKEWRKLYNG